MWVKSITFGCTPLSVDRLGCRRGTKTSEGYVCSGKTIESCALRNRGTTCASLGISGCDSILVLLILAWVGHPPWPPWDE